MCAVSYIVSQTAAESDRCKEKGGERMYSNRVLHCISCDNRRYRASQVWLKEILLNDWTVTK